MSLNFATQKTQFFYINKGAMHLSLGQLEQNVVKTLLHHVNKLVTFPHGHLSTIHTRRKRGISSRQKW
jgi:hypothetical protein